MIDFESGKEINRVKTLEGDAGFHIQKYGKNYVLSTVAGTLAYISMLDESVNTLWERRATDYERDYPSMNGLLQCYGNFVIINMDKIAFCPNPYSSLYDNDPIYSDDEDYVKIIELKTPEYLYGLNGKNAPLGEFGSYCYFISSIACESGIIHIEYKKCEWSENYDPISGNRLDNSFTDISRHYYDISADTYEVIGNGKIE
jgi:hypothetical protein